jgi:hypothetical protein
MSARRPLQHVQPWLGLAAAALGWGVSHQVASNAIFDDCNRAGVGFVLLVCSFGLAAAVAGGLFSWGLWRDREQTSGHGFVGLIGALLSALAGFAIILQEISALIIPPCAA